MKFRKLEIKDLDQNIIGKKIKDSNSDESILVIGWEDNKYLPIKDAIVEKKYLDYGSRIDEETLLRDFDIEIDDYSNILDTSVLFKEII